MTDTETTTPTEWDGELAAAKALSRIAAELDAAADQATLEANRCNARALEFMSVGRQLEALTFQADEVIHATYAVRFRRIALAASL